MKDKPLPPMMLSDEEAILIDLDSQLRGPEARIGRLQGERRELLAKQAALRERVAQRKKTLCESLEPDWQSSSGYP